ncbi:hypothetical protein SE15_10410 [Thermanaerothrix daxensis]|uniref:Glycosyl transferase family 1 domain-containing protein n=1 Tax=Thermanaerothrix daxensis TaxID=869279 RepID=A0A0P6YBJ8_9CHLR|nr:glycosyltransferase [Thermanaerothrix daxensis]KPL82534.1 hypothetical protein SE15_10410 [Thermanaerothrix daxensis]
MLKTPKVAIISGVQGDTRRYRAFHLREQLLLCGVECEYSHITFPGVGDFADWADVLILQRVTWNRLVEALLQRAKRHGALVFADVDDLVFSPEAYRWINSPDFVDPIRLGLYRENLNLNRETLIHCDGIIASTDFLAFHASQLSKPTWVHRNGFSLEMWMHSLDALKTMGSELNERIVLGYASGTPTHNRDFEIIKPVLQRLLDEYPYLHLHLVGHIHPGEDWGQATTRVHRLPFVPWRSLPKVLAQFSINLAPLRLDNPFSQSKSEIKYVEAALVKVPTVASPTAAYRYAIQHGKNGFLAADSWDWEEILRRLVEDANLRRAVGECAYQDVSFRYAPWKRAAEISALFNNAFEQLGGAFYIPERDHHPIDDPRVFQHIWLSEAVECRPNLIERGWYTLRARGVNVLLREIWIFIRRMLAPIFPFRQSKSLR